MKNKTIIILSIIFVVSLLLLVGCNGTEQYEGVKVEYYLEGGTWDNDKDVVYQYYQFKEGTTNLIKSLQSLATTEQQLTRSGYDFIGWFKTKNEDGTYSDEWDFSRDKVDDNGVVLYASWKRSVKYTYKIYDYDDPTTCLYTREVNEGVGFKNSYAANLKAGYTLVAVYDSEFNAWDTNFKHPGSSAEVEGETEVAVIVYAKYVEGSYTVVSTASELITAASSGQSIYLTNDIDMDGKSLTFNNYRKTFCGNGYTISNFVVSYESTNSDLVADFEDDSKQSLTISLFGNMTDATIKDVVFDNVSIDVKTTNSKIYQIYVAPIAISATNSTISNVTINGTITITKTPTGVEVKIAEDAVYKVYDESSSITDFNSDMVVQDNRNVTK